MLLEDITHPDDAARVAEGIIADLSKSFQLPQSDDVQIGVSIGISLIRNTQTTLKCYWITLIRRYITLKIMGAAALPIFPKT
ncbi:hypothetical protein [Methylobacter tundripaludum]|uniref:hypothetical protein n=1 Tax=Methylobacter tundripaludum TaxID=173365 RepID=UPI0029625328|nr:hypothetical protein [Methylobacter tundripaludum]